MGNYKAAVLFLGCVYLFCVEDTHAISCLKCDHHEHLSNCEGFETCKSDEVCYIEKYYNPEFNFPMFRAGCRNVHACKLISCNKDANSKQRRRETDDLVLCTDCCYSDLCNQNMCGGTFAGVNDTLRCFACQYVRSNETSVCSRIERCEKDELCSADYGYHNRPYFNYNFGCQKKARCDFLHQVALIQNVTLDTTCCDSHLCNVHPNVPLQNHSVVDNSACPTGIVKLTTTTATTTTTIPTTTTTIPTTPTTIPTTITTIPTTTTTLPTTTTTIPTTTTTITSTSTAAPTASTMATTLTSTVAPTASTVPASPGIRTDSVYCAICEGNPLFCESRYKTAECAYPNNYCINHVTNSNTGRRSVNRTCGNIETCYHKGSADNVLCQRFDPHIVFTLAFECTFCCVENNCNTDIKPH